MPIYHVSKSHISLQRLRLKGKANISNNKLIELETTPNSKSGVGANKFQPNACTQTHRLIHIYARRTYTNTYKHVT